MEHRQRQEFAAPAVDADDGITPVVCLARRAVASENRGKAMAVAGQGIQLLEVAAHFAGVVERRIHGTPDQAVAVNGLSEAIFKPACWR